MAGIDATIPLQIQAPSLEKALTPISTMLNLQQQQQNVQKGQQALTLGQQAIQQGDIATKQKQYEYGAQQGIGQAINDPANKNPDGSPNLDKLSSALFQADPRNVFASKTLADLATSKNNLNTFKSGLNKLTAEQQNTFGQSLVGLLNQTDKDGKPNVSKNDIRQALLDQQKMMPDEAGTEPMFQALWDQVNRAPNDPAMLNNFLRQTITHTAGAATLAGATTPGGVGVNTGAGGYTAQTNPLAPQPQGGMIPGSQYSAGIPPTTQEFRKDGPQGPGMYMVGQQAPPQPIQKTSQQPVPPGGVTPQMMGQPRQPARAAQPPLPMPGIVGQAQADYTTTMARADLAKDRVPVLQKIQMNVDTSPTSVAADRLALKDAVLGMIGMSDEQAARTSYDVMQKNMAQLVGGNTDAARDLASLANPHATMTRDAIKTTSRQLASVAQLDLAKQQFMQPFTQDPSTYSQKLVEWNKNANPNVLLYPQMSSDERDSLFKNMSQTDKQKFRAQAKWMQQNGLIQ